MDKFDFVRSRGVIWVCDLADSSKYLNDNKTADDLELFLPRLYWTGLTAVEAAGGKFIKWTGDGFLGWFETPLHRELGNRASAVFEAIWRLTVLVNVTQLGLSSEKKFHIRHGVTYEQDALMTKITHAGGYESLDITGRAVVLAFRLSGIEAPFPNVLTQKELANAYREHVSSIIDFCSWSPSQEEKLRYFKNEKWGTCTLFTSGEKKRRAMSLNALIRQGKKVILAVEGKGKPKYPETGYSARFIENFIAGPTWCSDVVEEYLSFISDDLFGSVKKFLEILENHKAAAKKEKMLNKAVE